MSLYREMFKIKFNNKEFMLFLAEHNRVAFLEVVNGIYQYPLLEDFLSLNKIYNERDPFVMNQTVSFIEKIKKIDPKRNVAPVMLALTIMLGNMPSAFASFKPEVTESEVIVSESLPLESYYTTCNSVSELESILGPEEITIEKLAKVISENANLTDHEKEVALDTAKAILNEYPDFNMRIYYENMKTIDVNTVSSEEYEKEIDRNSAANYVSDENLINNKEGCRDTVLSHELLHASHHYYRNFDGKIIRFNECACALDEAMNAKLNSSVGDEYAYKLEHAVLDFLMTCTDYTVYDYNEYGTSKLREKLQNQYPEIKAYFIIILLENLTFTNQDTEKQLSLDDTPLLEELFSYVLARIDINSDKVYQPLSDFYMMFEHVKSKDLMLKYLKEYNNELLKKGYSNIIKEQYYKVFLEEFDKVQGLIKHDDKIYPALNMEHDYYPLQWDETFQLKAQALLNYNPAMSIWLMNTINNVDIVPENYWKNVNVKMNGKFIANVYLRDFICFGIQENGEIGIEIISWLGPTIYQSAENLQNKTALVSFQDFIGLQDCPETIDINDYFTVSNIKRLVDNEKIANVNIANNKIEIEPNYILEISDIHSSRLINNAVLTNSEIGIFIEGLELTFICEEKLQQNYRLVDILKENHVFDENNEATLTSKELSSMIEVYIREHQRDESQSLEEGRGMKL